MGKLSEEDASFLTEFYEQYINESESLDWIESGLGSQYFKFEDLKAAFGLTDKQLGDLAEWNREHLADYNNGQRYKDQVKPGSGACDLDP
jgi:hypothetical protein